MKNLRRGALLVFTLCVSGLTAQAQEWNYAGDNGMNGYHRVEVAIAITKRPNGHEVTGEFRTSSVSCRIRGTYYPVNGQIRAICVWKDEYGREYKNDISGSQRPREDVFQLTTPRGTIVVRRGGTFEITSVTLPPNVKLNGPRGTLQVFWKGSPKFPIEMVVPPDSCPSGITCLTMRQTFNHGASPLVFKGAIWCAGPDKRSWLMDYSVYLRDANGKTTKRVNADSICQP